MAKENKPVNPPTGSGQAGKKQQKKSKSDNEKKVDDTKAGNIDELRKKIMEQHADKKQETKDSQPESIEELRKKIFERHSSLKKEVKDAETETVDEMRKRLIQQAADSKAEQERAEELPEKEADIKATKEEPIPEGLTEEEKTAKEAADKEKKEVEEQEAKAKKIAEEKEEANRIAEEARAKREEEEKAKQMAEEQEAKRVEGEKAKQMTEEQEAKRVEEEKEKAKRIEEAVDKKTEEKEVLVEEFVLDSSKIDEQVEMEEESAVKVKKSNKGILIIISIVVLLVAGTGIYFYFNQPQWDTLIAKIGFDKEIKTSSKAPDKVKTTELPSKSEAKIDTVKKDTLIKPVVEPVAEKEDIIDISDPNDKWGLKRPCYIVSHSAFRTQKYSKIETAKLKDMGYNAGYYWIPDYRTGGNIFFKVYVGPFNSWQEAEQMLPEVKKLRADAYVMKVWAK